MKKSCSRCGKIHDINYKCYANMTKKKNSNADKVRATNRWHKKSEEIKDRDHYLCQLCIRNLYDTYDTFNYKKLEVHHIVPIEEDNTLAFDDDNLITLCCLHHKKADKNLIPREVLLMINSGCSLKDIKEFISSKIVPPTF